jgi:hypothetical protein
MARPKLDRVNLYVGMLREVNLPSMGLWPTPTIEEEKVALEIDEIIFHLAATVGGWPIQARFWLEWGSCTTGHNPAAGSPFRVIQSDSIATARRDATCISQLPDATHLHCTFTTESTLPISPAPLTTIFHSFIFLL